MTSEIIRDYWDDVDTGTPSADQPRSVTASNEQPETWTPSSKWSPIQAPGALAAATEPPVASPSAPGLIERADRVSHQGSIAHASSMLQSPEMPMSSPRSFDLIHSAAARLLDLGSTRSAVLPVTDTNEDTVIQVDFPTEEQTLNSSPASDGIFLPGSAYLEFHSTLRNHTFQAARSTLPSRCATPERPPTRYGQDHGQEQSELPDDEEQDTSREGTAISAGPTPSYVDLTQQQELELWKNWIDEIAPWVRTEPDHEYNTNLAGPDMLITGPVHPAR